MSIPRILNREENPSLNKEKRRENNNREIAEENQIGDQLYSNRIIFEINFVFDGSDYEVIGTSMTLNGEETIKSEPKYPVLLSWSFQKRKREIDCID